LTAIELALLRLFRPGLGLEPSLALGVVVAISFVAALIDGIARHRRRKALRRLASEWKMTYSPSDRLKVRSKVIGHLPVPGAADVYVTDVIYGGEGDLYRYVFSAEYTLGAVRGKRRRVRAATFAEPRGRAAGGHPGPITLAPEGMRLIEQYEALRPLVSSNAAGSLPPRPSLPG
jgi:hypothetical protein